MDPPVSEVLQRQMLMGIRCEGERDRVGRGQRESWLQPASSSGVGHSCRVLGIWLGEGGS